MYAELQPWQAYWISDDLRGGRANSITNRCNFRYYDGRGGGHFRQRRDAHLRHGRLKVV